MSKIEVGNNNSMVLDGKVVPGIIFREGKWWMDVAKIKVKGNPREDFGDLDGLVASVKENGIKTPLAVNIVTMELEAGERRLKSAKTLKLEEVPIDPRTGDEEHHFVGRLVENEQREDFTLLEEAKGFKAYMDKFKAKPGDLAKRLGKPITYIEKRIDLLNLDADTKKALQGKKIKIGHALALGKMTDLKKRKKVLKETISEDYSVGATISEIRRESLELNNAPFDKKDCKGCEYNGSTKNLADWLGTKSLEGNCLDRSCFVKKRQEWLDATKKSFKDLGIKIISKAEYTKWDDYENRVRYCTISDHDADLKKLYKEKCVKCDKLRIFIGSRYNDDSTDITKLCLKPNCYNNKGEAPKGGNKLSDKEKKEKFISKIREYKDVVMQMKTSELLKPKTHESKAMALYVIVNYLDYNHPLKKKILDMGMAKILKLDDDKIEEYTTQSVTMWIRMLGGENIDSIGQRVGVNLSKHWKMDEKFINLMTRDNLEKLAKEMKIDISKVKKVKEIKAVIVKAAKVGMVPKVMK
ncbi:MAG: ParB/RepB/Spo0J family partition protein [Candidatus Hodarchaeales archaeon]